MNKESNKNGNIFQNLKKNIKNMQKDAAGDSVKNLFDINKTLSGNLKNLKYKDQISFRQLLHDKIKNNNIIMTENILNFEKNKKEENREKKLSIKIEEADSDLDEFPYDKALRIDNRNIRPIFFSGFISKIDLIENIFFRDRF